MADAEATAVERHFHVVEAFHPGLRTSLHGRLICYARAVAVQEWPQLEHGEHSELVDDWSLESEIAVERADLGDPVEAHALGLFDELEPEREQARRDRIAAAERFVPALLWVALIAGGTVLILCLTTFANRGIRPALQALLVGGWRSSPP